MSIHIDFIFGDFWATFGFKNKNTTNTIIPYYITEAQNRFLITMNYHCFQYSN